VGCLLYPNKSDIVQAEAIVALVFVTLVYAIETHKLVKEGKIKRIAAFYEKRINEFYAPFIKKLNDLRDELHNDTSETAKMNDLRNDARYFIWQKEYMASEATVKKIQELLDNILFADLDRSKEAFKKYRESEKVVRNIIIEEQDKIIIKIRKIYGYS
jgi:phage regulator Rha-like protein